MNIKSSANAKRYFDFKVFEKKIKYSKVKNLNLLKFGHRITKIYILGLESFREKINHSKVKI